MLHPYHGGPLQRFANDVFGRNGDTEEFGRHLGHRLPLLLIGAAGGHRCTGADTQEIRVAAPLPQAAHQHGHVGPLAATVGVQLVQHQKLQLGHRPVHKDPLVGSGEHQLQHHVVGQEDVRRIVYDRLLLFQALLTGIAGKTDGEVGDVGG